MSLREADLTNKYKIIVLTTLKNSDDPQEREASGIAQSDTILHEKDLLVLFGELSDIKRLIEKGN
jgi:trk system potassium uptake protein TrkA